jgi:hypothetical protein
LQRVLLMPEYGASRDLAFNLKRHLDAVGILDPGHFIDMCSVHRDRPESDEMEVRFLQEVQEAEMLAALDWTYRGAIGS